MMTEPIFLWCGKQPSGSILDDSIPLGYHCPALAPIPALLLQLDACAGGHVERKIGAVAERILVFQVLGSEAVAAAVKLEGAGGGPA